MDDIRGVLERLEKAVVGLTARVQPALPLVLTVKAAAVQLSVSERTMRALVASGEVPSVLVGGRRMVPSAELVQMTRPVSLEAVRRKRSASKPTGMDVTAELERAERIRSRSR